METVIKPSIITESLSELTAPMSPHHWSDLALASLALVGCWVIGKILKKQIEKWGKLASHSTLFISLAATISKAICIGIGVLLFIGILGINVSAIIKILAVLGFGISFIFRDIVTDLISGFFIAGYKSFTIGTTISITLETIPYNGIIKAIDLRYIILETATENILIPNSLFLRHAVRISKK